MSSNYVEVPGSHRAAPKGAVATGAVMPGEVIEVSIYLKDREPDPLADEPADEAVAAETRAQLNSARAESVAGDIGKVVAFANDAGLSVVKQEPGRRLVKLRGTAEKIEAAFRTKLHNYNDGERAFRSRSGSLSAPADVVEAIDAVLGLDTRPAAMPRLARHPDPHVIGGHKPNAVAALYKFPVTAGRGAGQCIALIELGGGYRASDNAAAFAAMGLPVPTVVPVSVSGGQNNPGPNANADGEVALDIQVAGGAAPRARIAVYFAPNTFQGFVDAVSRAVHDPINKPSVISISWGAPEVHWTGQAVTAMNGAFRDAARLGITVLAASGDNLATDGVSGNALNVDFPASSPYVLGCGGTRIDTQNGAIVDERVWNNVTSGTGGGVSALFALPSYQANANVPAVHGRPGRWRGVPDVAADADPNSGYLIVVAGAGQQIGGTSAVAPLWAGLFALVNEASGQHAGFAHLRLYSHPSVFRDILTGNNRIGGVGYDAHQGWDACTGLGVPKGVSVARLFAGVNRHEEEAVAAE